MLRSPYRPPSRLGGLGANKVNPAPPLRQREAGTSCEPNSEDYEQRTDALRCQDDYLKAVEEEIAKSTCKNTQYTITEDYEYGPMCDLPRDERKDVPRCSENCSLRQFYYLYCTYLGESNREISRECGQPWVGASFCGFDNGEFCLLRYAATLLLTYSCPASEEGEFECSDDCRKAAENYKEEVGCCVSYWQEGTGGSGDGESVADIFSACGVEMPDSCTEIHPPEEFLDCAHGDGGNVAGNGSAEMLGSWVLLVTLTSATLVIVGVC